MAEGSLAKKMKLTPGARAAVVNAPESYFQGLAHDCVISKTISGKFDWIQIFVRNKAELEALVPKAVKALKPVAILWVSFPKGISNTQTDLTRDNGWESVQSLDLKWITLISINDLWSAFALRPYKEGEKHRSLR